MEMKCPNCGYDMEPRFLNEYIKSELEELKKKVVKIQIMMEKLKSDSNVI